MFVAAAVAAGELVRGGVRRKFEWLVLKLVEIFWCIWRCGDEVLAVVKMKVAMMMMVKQFPTEPPHWRFCYSMFNNVPFIPFALHHIDAHLRDAICVFYLVLRALDTIEDDSSIETEVKAPILRAFHRHIYNRDWHFSCGTKDYKVLMDDFHHVSTAFLELDHKYQETIEDITMRMGEGMTKFISKEIETLDDYDEYCHHVLGLVAIGMLKILHGCGKQDIVSDDLCDGVGLFLQKIDIIKDYLEDINEMPKPRIFWPRQIWGKYVNKLEDFKDEDNSSEALLCLNEMITNALLHVKSYLIYISSLRDPIMFRFFAFAKVAGIATLALCYNNIQVFRGGVELRYGLVAKIFYRTKTMSDVYDGLHDFSLILKSKINDNDPNARETKDRINNILKICGDSGTLNRRNSYII
ncbi:squalene synthase 8-like isoform X1 [Andrographis paniculata]|uniref:squalene synthase 8-like isoform X1 n=1 Tax=Andrographis paniculata TaxID=175694 RepID=UPI0021E8FBEE|nr:squalene synthase 8-like isoform X1 [Andrographis paniculata]